MRTVFVPLLFLIFISPAQAVTLKIATLSPDGSFWMQKLREGGDEIAKKTEGRVKFKFYPGGVMGKDKDVLRKIRLHQLHGAAITGNTLSHIYPDIRLYTLLLKFHGLDEVDYVRQKMDKELMAGLEQNGFVSLGLAEIGMAYIMSLEPVQELGQMRSRKAWVPENNKLALVALEAFSISPIPLPIRDVLMGLQTNMIDIVAGSPVAALALQWHTKVKYVTDLPLSYIFGVLALDQKAFNKIPKQDQAIVRSVMGRIIKEVDQQNRQDNIKAKDAMIKLGIQFLKPTKQAADELRKISIIANEKLVKDGNLSANTVKELNKHLADYRKLNP
ncbi:MAG: TRAP transporter substrate-binding protein DctP [Methylococcaceae bacterium]|nr:TRAP transporter substrate-binding protein DctP [Methylococcaceae bacterium]